MSGEFPKDQQEARALSPTSQGLSYRSNGSRLDAVDLEWLVPDRNGL